MNEAPDLAELLHAFDSGEKLLLCSEQAFLDLLVLSRRNQNGENTPVSQPENRQSPVLNKKQKQILFLIAEGLQNQQIACALGLSLRNVRARISELLAWFNVKRRGELVSQAVKLGLIVPEEQFLALRAKAAGSGR